MSKPRKKAERPLVYELVKIDHDQVVTTSRIIAERFDKDHPNVLKAIRAIIHGPVSRVKNDARDPLTPEQRSFADALRRDFAKNYRLSSYKDERGKDQPEYLLNNDAARKLIMGFTGEKAEVWQFLFIRAFSEMEKELQRQRSNVADPQRQIERAAGIAVRRAFTDVCKEFEGYGLPPGRLKGSGMSYMNYTKFINRSLFAPEDGKFTRIRERRLETDQIRDVATVERAAARCLQECMAAGMTRKECRPAVEAMLAPFCAMIGKTSVPPLNDVRPALPGMERAA